MPVEPLQRIAVAERDRLVRDVPAREHERLDAELGEVGQQNVVQRRVREHHAELGHAGRDRARPPARPACAAPARSAARPRRAASARPRRARRARSAAAASRTISANGRSSRRLRVRSSRTALLVGRVAGQVVAADALDREHRAVGEPARGGANGVVGRRERAIGAPPPSSSRARRPAGRAGVRLGVEAPVAGIVVLAPARRAHRERRPSSWTAGRTARPARS